MRKRRTAALATAAAVAGSLIVGPLGGTAAADECTRYVGGALGTPKVPLPAQVAVIPVATPVATFYLEARQILSEDSTYSIWVYEETNRVAGLQRGSDARKGRFGLLWAPLEGIAGSWVDPCHDTTSPDQAVF